MGTEPHSTVLRQKSSVTAAKIEDSAIATFILSRYKSTFDAEIQLSLRMSTEGQFVLLFRFQDLFNHMGLEASVNQIAL